MLLLRGLTLNNPWAMLVANGSKKIETRSFSTRYRGIIAIHSSKTFKKEHQQIALLPAFDAALGHPGHEVIEQSCGMILAVAHLTRCEPTSFTSGKPNVLIPHPSTHEFTFGDYSPGRWMWDLEGVTKITPIRIKGMLGLWSLPEDTIEEIMADAKSRGFKETLPDPFWEEG